MTFDNGAMRRGFSLMEVIVAMGIFAVSVVAMSDLALTASRAHRRALALLRLENEVEAVIEVIASTVRDGVIDTDLTVPATVLAFRTETGESVQFERRTFGCPSGSSACLAIARPDSQGSLAWAPFTAPGVTVDAFSFRSTPAPPRATVFLALSNEGGRGGVPVRIETQTTVAGRP